eukprot:Phypoly_transcript_00580.p1 GENE.Phypoly_transcript_00580~~Phypoly_transcript_00580.p1  ORF type:complete len:688 (+),score=81.68 Phypoly_transcript_00580:295-2358(+)
MKLSFLWACIFSFLWVGIAKGATFNCNLAGVKSAFSTAGNNNVINCTAATMVHLNANLLVTKNVVVDGKNLLTINCHWFSVQVQTGIKANITKMAIMNGTENVYAAPQSTVFLITMNIHDSYSGRGGGIHVDGNALVWLIQSSLYNNQPAPASGLGSVLVVGTFYCRDSSIITNTDRGMQIFQLGTAVINYCTILQTGGLSEAIIVTLVGAVLNITNSIASIVVNQYGLVNSGGNNLFFQVDNQHGTVNYGPGDFSVPTYAALGLNAPGLYGGRTTYSCPLLATSPAINMVNLDKNPLVYDQNVNPRVAKGAADAGAIESNFFASIQATPSSATANENQAALVNFKIGKLWNNSHPVIHVSWTTVDGTAKSGIDYVAKSGQITFNYLTPAQTIQISVQKDPDHVIRPPRTFSIKMTSADGNPLNSPTITINDNDKACPLHSHVPPTGAWCVCDAGYKGLVNNTGSCTLINTCSPNPCGAHATCTNNAGISHTCTCDQYYQGDGHTCTPINYCAGVNCGANSTCTSHPGYHNCTCKPYYQGNGTNCKAIDYCAGVDCGPHTICTSNLGYHNCSCEKGYYNGSGVCTLSHSCAENPCSLYATCTNVTNSYNCSCNFGYTGDGFTCTPIDYCAEATCGANATCTNLIGSANCSCDYGFTGDGQTCTCMNTKRKKKQEKRKKKRNKKQEQN